MKSKIESMNHLLGGAAYAGVFLLLTCSASAIVLPAQNLFVTSCINPGSIYEYTPGGTQSAFASTGLNFPYGLAIDSAGNLFVANSLDDAGIGGYVTEITPGGVQSTIPSGPDPKALAFNSAGDLFETDYHSGNIYEYTPGGTLSIFVTVTPAPQALAFNSAGDLFVGTGYGNGNESITKITPNGTQSTFATGLGYIAGLAFNSAGDLFEADGGSGNIYEFMPGGVQSTFASVPNPNSLAFDSAGDLFVTAGGDNIYEYTSGGVQSTFASGIDAAVGLAFQGVTLPVPEPSALVLVAAGASAWLSYCRRKFVEQRSK
jgi:hypothetical protein